MGLILRRNHFSYLSQIFKIVQTLPTSSSPVEQTFSLMKLVKTAIRNRLQDKTLQSLLMINQEYKDCNKDKRIVVADEVVNLFNQNKDDLNFRKSRLKDIIILFLLFLGKDQEENKDILKKKPSLSSEQNDFIGKYY